MDQILPAVLDKDVPYTVAEKVKNIYLNQRYPVKLILAFIIFCQCFCFPEELSPEWKKRINQILSGTLDRYHYVDQSIDDNYSKRIFQLFLNRIDPTKTFFTENQIIELTAYEYKIDNDIRNNTFYFYDLCLLRLKE